MMSNKLWDLVLKSLKQLRNTFNEIACANNILKDQAGQKFYNDIEEEYDK